MSHSYDTSTYAADASLVPERLTSPDQLRVLSTPAFVEQEQSPGTLVYMFGSTRSGWAIYTSKALVEAVNLPSLRFLSDEGQHKFETEHGFTAVTIFEPGSLPGVASDLRRLLDLVKQDPILAMDADAEGMFGVEEVAAALARDYVSPKPAFDYGNVSGDDGQSADYLFTWLRSILRIVEVAQSSGRAVVHELKV